MSVAQCAAHRQQCCARRIQLFFQCRRACPVATADGALVQLPQPVSTMDGATAAPAGVAQAPAVVKEEVKPEPAIEPVPVWVPPGGRSPEHMRASRVNLSVPMLMPQLGRLDHDMLGCIGRVQRGTI